MTHADKILLYMREKGSITPIDALREIGCFRLGARIYDLRARGYNINTKMETHEGRFGPVTFARYSLGGKK